MVKKEEKRTGKKAKAAKDFLFKVVDEYPKANWKLVGVLSAEGLLEQYEYEVDNNGYVVLEPSITKSEFDKIVDKYYGE